MSKEALERNWKQMEEGFRGRYEGNPEYSRYRWFLEKMPPPPANVLEIGCNSAKALEWLAKKGYICVGVDYPQVIEGIEFHHPNMSFIGTNVDVPNADNFLKELEGKFDVVICAEVLQHIVFDANVLYGIWHYLKSGGIILLSTENLDKGIPSVIRFYPRTNIVNVLTKLGFDIIEWTTAVQEGYIAVCAKKGR